jgi:nicotinate phosphoribosyltransferase
LLRADRRKGFLFPRRSGMHEFLEDVLTLEDDPQEGQALIEPVMRAGRRVAPALSLGASRALAAAQLGSLPDRLRRLEGGERYAVHVAPALRALAAAVDARTR